MSGFKIMNYLGQIFNKNEDQSITSFQETDPKRQRVYNNMSDEEKKKYIERKVRDLKYIIKRQKFLTAVIKELDKEIEEDDFENIMIKISQVYGNTQMIDIFSYEHYLHWKSDTDITPLFELIDDCYNINKDDLKNKIINWLFNKTKKKEIKWDIIIGLFHCEYFNYDTIDVLIDTINKHIEPVDNGVLSNHVLDKISSLIIPKGYSLAGQSFLARWIALAREFKDYESIQKILNAGFKLEYKASGKDEIVLNTQNDGLMILDIPNMLEKIDLFLMENIKNEDVEFLNLKMYRSNYKYSLIHKMFLNFNEKDSDLLILNKIIPDQKDILFFEAIVRKNFRNKKIIDFLDSLLPEEDPKTIRLKKNIPVIKEFLPVK